MPAAAPPAGEPAAEPTPAVAAEEDPFAPPAMDWDEEPEDPAAPPAEGDKGEEVDYQGIRELLGEDGSKHLTDAQQNALWHKVMAGSRGKKIYGAYQETRKVEKEIGRPVDSEQILRFARDSQTLDELVGTLRQGPDGARIVLQRLTTAPDGAKYAWADNLLAAARAEIEPQLQSSQQQLIETHEQRQIDSLLTRAARQFAGGNAKTGEFWLTTANGLYYAKHGEPHPSLKAVREGSYTPQAIDNAPGAQPKSAPSPSNNEDPEKAEMRRQLEEMRNGQLATAFNSWGADAQDDIDHASAMHLKGLKTLADNGVITERVYQREVEALNAAIWNAAHQDIGRISLAAKEAITRRDRAALDFQRGELRSIVARAARSVYKQFLEPYREQLTTAGQARQQANSRTVQAGQHAEVVQTGVPSSPAMSSTKPDGSLKGNRAWLASQLSA